MGRRGPIATPTRILELNGSWRAKKRRGEPRPKVKAPSCPSWLGVSGKRLWRELTPRLLKIGLVSELDRTLLAALCHSYEMFRQARTTVLAEGLTTTTDKGNIVQHPAVGAMNTAWGQMVKAAAEFGLSPASRARFDVDIPKPEDALDRFLREKGNVRERFRRPG